MKKDNNWKLKWVGDLEDDVTATEGNYILRAEHMGGWVWWEVSFAGETIAGSAYDEKNPPALTMRGAMLRCLYAMKRHKKELRKVKIE